MAHDAGRKPLSVAGLDHDTISAVDTTADTLVTAWPVGDGPVAPVSGQARPAGAADHRLGTGMRGQVACQRDVRAGQVAVGVETERSVIAGGCNAEQMCRPHPVQDRATRDPNDLP